MFYQSKKFQYAAVHFVVAMITSLIPVLMEMTPEETEQMYLLAGVCLAFGFVIIGGHQIMDMKSVDLLKPGAALDQLLEAVQVPPQEVVVGEIESVAVDALSADFRKEKPL